MNLYSYIILFIIISMITACDRQPIDSTLIAQQSTPRSCQITMGYDVWEPYQYIDLNQKVTGLDVELIQLITKKLGCTLSYSLSPWNELLQQIEEGDIDIVLGASMTTKRQDFAYFSEPYRQESFQLFIRQDGTKQMNTIDSISDFIQAGHKLGLVNEYYYGDELDQLLNHIDISQAVTFSMMSEINVVRLLDHDIDGFLEDTYVGMSLLRRKGLNKYIHTYPLQINTGDIFVMFSQKTIQPDFVQEFNQALAIIKANGQYQKLLDKYSI